MPKEEHLEILKRGVKVWNQWREENLEVFPDFSGVDLEGAILTGANLTDVLFPYANLSQANLNGAFLRGVDFRGANLIGADLSEASPSKGDFHGADLSEAILIKVDLSAADLSEANLSHANLSEAQLSWTNFNRTILVETEFNYASMGATLLGDVDLSTAKNLKSIRHTSPSTIGINTLYNSKGQIPESFLRGAGVPENFITYMHSLTSEAFDYYSCFISYTEADDLFVERLYNDLQAGGVRVWRWREDAPWGKSLMGSVDQAIRVYDKLVVICSESSLQAPPVIREIERALQKEDALAKQGKEPEVLFPIRLDDYIFNKWEHHRKADVVAKNVGEFGDWEDPEAYKKAFERLLRDLGRGGKRRDEDGDSP